MRLAWQLLVTQRLPTPQHEHPPMRSPPEFVAARCFSEADQEAFAKLSGDFNPMHMDALHARRTQAGERAVHGVHACLWALDQMDSRNPTLKSMSRLTVRFLRFIHLNRTVTLVQTRAREDRQQFEIRDGDSCLMSLRLDLTKHNDPVRAARDGDASTVMPVEIVSNKPAEPELLSVQNMSECISADPQQISNCNLSFPALEAAVGTPMVHSMALLSTIVGMRCPGMHSIFSGFVLNVDKQANQPGLAFRVRNADERFSLVNIDARGMGFTAGVDAFFRQSPLSLPSVRELSQTLPSSCFKHVNALVIGGSRGLGEATARLLVSGGARVTITYAYGEDDALGVQHELNLEDERCTVMRFNVLETIKPQLAQVDRNITHLFYFATPRIFRQNTALFDSNLLDEFMRVYVQAFHETCLDLHNHTDLEQLDVFYPSSTAINERPPGMTEYSMAKSAGEILCQDLNQLTGLTTWFARLPRTRTDQTATVTPVETADPITLMRQHLLQQLVPSTAVAS